MYSNSLSVQKNTILPPIHEYFKYEGFPYPGWAVYNQSKNGNTWKWIRLPMDTTKYLLGISEDITERKQAEAENEKQLDELRRWHTATLGREGRIREVKKEVNELLARLGQMLNQSQPVGLCRAHFVTGQHVTLGVSPTDFFG